MRASFADESYAPQAERATNVAIGADYSRLHDFPFADGTAPVGEALRREYTENDPEFAKDRLRRPRVIESWKTDQKRINGERYQSLR